MKTLAIGIYAPYSNVSFSAFPKPRQKRFLGEKLDQKVVQQRGLEIIKAIITVLIQNACSSHKNMNSKLIFNRENQLIYVDCHFIRILRMYRTY